jgi:hypothetical protein
VTTSSSRDDLNWKNSNEGNILLAGLAQVGRHLDVVLRDAVVVVIFSSTRKLKFEVLFNYRFRFRASVEFGERTLRARVLTLIFE